VLCRYHTSKVLRYGTRSRGISQCVIQQSSSIQCVTGLDDWPASDVQVLMGYVYILYWQVATERTGGQF